MKATLVVTLLLGAVLTLAACGDDDSGNPTPTPYPSEIAWEQAPDLLATGEVEMVVQTHALAVSFRMKDGSEISTTEPGIDDIFRLVDECGEPCGGLALATE